MNQRINETMVEWINYSVNQWILNSMNQWTNEPLHEWTSESLNQRTNDWMNEWVDEPLNQWTNESMNQWSNESVNQWTNERRDGWVNGWMAGWLDGWMGELLFFVGRLLHWAAPLLSATSCLRSHFNWATRALSCLPASSFVASATQFFSSRSFYNAFGSRQPQSHIAQEWHYQELPFAQV
mgnify:CR=1 FL=1